MLNAGAHVAHGFLRPGLRVVTVRVEPAEDERPPCWFVVIRRRLQLISIVRHTLGPPELVSMLGMSEPWASRSEAQDAATAGGGTMAAARIVWSGSW